MCTNETSTETKSKRKFRPHGGERTDDFSAYLGDSHAVACREISVHKLLLSQILHPLGHLQPEANQILDGGVLNESHKHMTKRQNSNFWRTINT